MRANFSLDYDVLSVQQPTKLYLLARFESGKPITKRRLLNIGLVIDRSGSMAGSRIDYTRQAAQFLVQHLGADDMLSVVLYNDKIETLLSPQTLRNKDQVIQRLEHIKVRGTTNLSGGWLEGCANVAKNKSDDYLNRVILMSDGHANRGVTDQAQLVQMARQKYDNEGISSTMMGLGNDFNEDLLMTMANAGGGAFYFIESPEVAPTIFQEELSGLLNVVGQNLSITIEPTNHVKLIQQLNAYSVDLDGRNVTFRLGDIFADEVKTLVMELTIPAMSELGEVQIANLKFAYDEITPDGTNHHIIEQPVMMNVAEQTQKALPNREVMQSVLLLQAANARKQAVAHADKGDYKEAARLLNDVVSAIEDAKIDDEYLNEERRALQAQAQQFEKNPEKYDEYSRKTMSTQAFYSMTSRHEESVILRTREIERDAQKGSKKTAEPKNMRRTQEADMVTMFDDESVAQSLSSSDADPLEELEGDVPRYMTWNDELFELDGDLMRLGRATQNELIINEKGVSRFHAQIVRRDGALYIEDLDSTNGTMIRGKRLRRAYRLSAGDEAFLCDEKLVFHLQPPVNDEADKKDDTDDEDNVT
jgi:Ca-activated chloride channel family protein